MTEPESFTPRVSFRLPQWLLQRVEAHAQREGRTVSNMLKKIVEWWAEGEEQNG